MDYTVEKIDTLDDEFRTFLKAEMYELSKMYDGVFDPNYCAMKEMLQKGIVFICRRNGEVTGFHISWLSRSSLDVTKKVLQQQIFYVKPDSGRSAYHLFKKFIDFGKSQADHVITMIASHTNIKPSSLESLGFKELETLYRLEV